MSRVLVQGLAAAIVLANSQSSETNPVVLKTEPLPEPIVNPPRRLSNDATHRDFHISFMRVGLRIDDKERDDVCWYDADALRYRVVGSKVEQPALSIEPYWRYPESRQNRRQRERWEASHAHSR